MTFIEELNTVHLHKSKGNICLASASHQKHIFLTNSKTIKTNKKINWNSFDFIFFVIYAVSAFFYSFFAFFHFLLTFGVENHLKCDFTFEKENQLAHLSSQNIWIKWTNIQNLIKAIKISMFFPLLKLFTKYVVSYGLCANKKCALFT